MWSVSADPLKFEEAVRWFEGKVPLLPGEFKQLEAEAKRRAFTMAGVAELDRMAWLHQTLLEAIESGQTLDEWRGRVRERLANAHPLHLETVFRTNVQSAYSAGRWAQLNHPAVRKARPFWMYDAIMDGRTTEICKERHDTVLPADDPWWRENTPPLHFNALDALTPVFTDRGWRAIRDVHPGDLVLTHRGRFRPVYGKYCKPARRLLRLETDTGRVLFVTHEHPVLTPKGWKAFGDLEVGDQFFEYEEEALHLLEGVLGKPDDGPPLFDEVTIAFKIMLSALSVGVVLPVKLERYLMVWKSEVYDVGANRELGDDGDAADLKESPELGFAWGELLSIVFSDCPRHLDTHCRVTGRVPFAHPARMSGIELAGFLGFSEVGVGGAAKAGAPPIGDGCLSRLTPNGNTVPFTPARQARLPDAQGPLEFAQGSPVFPMLLGDKRIELFPVSEKVADVFHRATITHIAVVNSPSGWVCDLSVWDDESYTIRGAVVHNCRSGIRALTPEQAKARGVASAPPEGKPPQAGFGLAPDAKDWGDTYARGLRARIGDAGGWELAFAGPPPDWTSYGLTQRLPERKAPRRPLPTIAEVGEAVFLEQLAAALGGLPAYLRDPSGLAVVVDSRLLEHLRPDGRERFLAWLGDLITDPEELWLVPMKRTGGRRVVFRQRYLKVYREGRKRHLIFVAEFHRGVMVGFTFFETRYPNYLQNMRKGFLRYAKEQK